MRRQAIIWINEGLIYFMGIVEVTNCWLFTIMIMEKRYDKTDEGNLMTMLAAVRSILNIRNDSDCRDGWRRWLLQS